MQHDSLVELYKILSRKVNKICCQLNEGVGGVSAFTSLTDVPNAYTGSGGYVVAVTVGEDGLEFIPLAGGGDMLLGTAQTVIAAKTFNSGTLKLAGSTSGTTTLIPTAIAGTGTVTLPTSGTLYGTAASSFSSSQLSTSLSDKTGTGVAVFAINAALVTPNIGVATATSINKVTITAPAAAATLTIANNKVFTVSNTLTLTGTDTSSVNFGAGGTVIFTTNKISDLAVTTSVELISKISDATGTGSLVFGTDPTFPTNITVGAVGSATGIINIKGTTSGTVSLSVNDAAGTYTFKFPNGPGTANYLMSTDGSGNTSWVAALSEDMSDSLFRIHDDGDVTKKLAFEVSSVTTGTTRTITVQDASGTLVLRDTTDTLTNKTLDDTTITGNLVSSKAGVVSNSALKFTGAPYTGGTITTTKPLVLIEPSGVASSTNWSTAGTAFGINLPNAFAGDIVNIQKDSTTIFRINSTGIILPAGSAASPIITINAPGGGVVGLYSSASNTLSFSVGGGLRAIWSNSIFASNTTGSYSMTVGAIGSASAPTYSFVGDTNTGMYSGAADVLSFSSGGTLRLAISNSNITASSPLITLASTTGAAGFNIPAGVAPTTPTNGDIWQDGTDLKIRIGGTTKTFTLIP